MNSSTTLAKIHIFARDSGDYYKYAVADWLDRGNGVMVYLYDSNVKLSRHSDGRTYQRVVGAQEQTPPTVLVPFSEIRRELVREVRIPPKLSQFGLPHRGPLPANSFTFSSTTLKSNGSFAAEVVDDSLLDATLASWQNHPQYLSTQTWRSNDLGKTLILTVLNDRSTGSTGATA